MIFLMNAVWSPLIPFFWQALWSLAWLFFGMWTSLISSNELIYTLFFDMPLTLYLYKKGWLYSKKLIVFYCCSILFATAIIVPSCLWASNQPLNYFVCYLIGLIICFLPAIAGLFELNTNFKDYLTLHEDNIRPEGYQYILKTFCIQYTAPQPEPTKLNAVNDTQVRLKIGKFFFSLG